MEKKKELSEVIDRLMEQVSVKALSTKDLVEEMQDLFEKVQSLELELETTTRLKVEYFDEVKELEKKLIPQEAVEKREVKLSKAEQEFRGRKFKFDTESKFIERENNLLTEMIKSMLTNKSHSYYDGNNGASYNETNDKPSIQAVAFAMDQKEKAD